VVLKAAPETPWTATFIGRIAAQQTDMPAGVLNVLTSADRSGLGEQLVSDARVDVVSFTGSTATGRRVMANAAATVKRVFLSLAASPPPSCSMMRISAARFRRLRRLLPRRPGVRDPDATAAAAATLRGGC
jgi:delta 1-pyrroline-5-carboxylate dehydrogenase